jgi:hypothetical protein
MKDGNWVPMDKGLVGTLPVNRPFSEVEAMFSLQVSYDNDTPVSVSGLAKSWKWNRKKVALFLEKIGIALTGAGRGVRSGGRIAPGQNQRDISRDISGTFQGTFKGHFKFNKSEDLENKKDIKGTLQGTFEGHLEGHNYKDYKTNTTLLPPENGNGGGGDQAVSPAAASKPRIPYRKIVDVYNRILGEALPEVKALTEQRKKAIKRIWQGETAMKDIARWEAFFGYVSENDFLMGKKSDWRATFDWLTNFTNFVKIAEGNYER